MRIYWSKHTFLNMKCQYSHILAFFCLLNKSKLALSIITSGQEKGQRNEQNSNLQIYTFYFFEICEHFAEKTKVQNLVL